MQIFAAQPAAQPAEVRPTVYSRFACCPCHCGQGCETAYTSAMVGHDEPCPDER